jgi:hypothetical protein
MVAPPYTRTYNSQSGFSLRINGTKQTTHLYLGDQVPANRFSTPENCHLLTLQQWDSNSLWESRYIWLPVAIDEAKKSLQVEWHDVYDLNMYAPIPNPHNFPHQTSTLTQKPAKSANTPP